MESASPPSDATKTIKPPQEEANDPTTPHEVQTPSQGDKQSESDEQSTTSKNSTAMRLTAPDFKPKPKDTVNQSVAIEPESPIELQPSTPNDLLNNTVSVSISHYIHLVHSGRSKPGSPVSANPVHILPASRDAYVPTPTSASATSVLAPSRQYPRVCSRSSSDKGKWVPHQLQPIRYDRSHPDFSR